MTREKDLSDSGERVMLFIKYLTGAFVVVKIAESRYVFDIRRVFVSKLLDN
jgi:hypothetical protein